MSRLLLGVSALVLAWALADADSTVVTGTGHTIGFGELKVCLHLRGAPAWVSREPGCVSPSLRSLRRPGSG